MEPAHNISAGEACRLRRVEIMRLLREIDSQFKKDVAFQVTGRASSLRFSYRIFKDNLNEFIKWTCEESYPKFYTLINDPRNHDLANEYWTTFIRKLHSVLAAAKTLIDHTFVVRNDIAKHNPVFGIKYNEIAELQLKNDPLAKFVSDFRNFIIHFGLIGYILQHTFDSQRGTVPRFILNIQDLKEWSGWTAPSSRFLLSLDEKTSIQDIFLQYDKKIQAFYEVFYSLVNTLFAEEIKNYQIEIDRYNALVTELNNDR
jgi:hypothetical protein